MTRGAECDRLILASSSPRRRELLARAGYSFDVVDPPMGEPDDDLSLMSPDQQAEALAYFKARSVWEGYGDCVVLGADTVVAGAGPVLGKPADADEARAMLKSLSGTRHRVITGVVILGGAQRIITSDTTFVTMREMTPAELDGYVASGEWEGKAGAYAIQETADRFVTSVEGSFSNVIGLPMELVARLLDGLGMTPVEGRS